MRPSLPYSLTLALLLAAPTIGVSAQEPGAPPQLDPRIYDIIDAASPQRVESDVRTLAGFGTRNTFSDTLSDTRGIGAARRWIKAEFDRISEACGGCLEVSFQSSVVPASRRVPEETGIVNVVAIQRGTLYPNRYVIMSGDIDSRASRGNDAETDAPGANDNATGMAGAMEAARVLTGYSFPTSIVYLGLSGEEQGLLGGRSMAEKAAVTGSMRWHATGQLSESSSPRRSGTCTRSAII